MSPHFFLALAISSSLCARIIPESYVFSDWMSKFQTSTKNYVFQGLSWQLSEPWSCERNREEFVCSREGSSGSTLIFRKFTLLSSDAGPLLKLLRKQEWQKYKLIHYVEETITTALGSHTHSIGQVLEYNNILRPVLLKAFDVVLDGKTCISITSQCTVSDCPVIEKEVREMLSSLKITARK